MSEDTSLIDNQASDQPVVQGLEMSNIARDSGLSQLAETMKVGFKDVCYLSSHGDNPEDEKVDEILIKLINKLGINKTELLLFKITEIKNHARDYLS